MEAMVEHGGDARRAWMRACGGHAMDIVVIRRGQVHGVKKSNLLTWRCGEGGKAGTRGRGQCDCGALMSVADAECL